MLKLQSYLICSLLCFLNIFNYSDSVPINSDENTTHMTTEKIKHSFSLGSRVKNEIIVRSTAIPLYKKNVGVPISLLIHRIHKRAIDPNQGASWLKYIWRERQYKIPQMWLTNIRNLWAADPIGGKNLFDAGVPYGAVFLMKTLLLDSMFPRIGKNQ